MSEPETDREQSTTSSGWEKADNVAGGIGAAVSGIGWVFLKIYAIALIVVGIVVFNLVWWAAILLFLYGLYLLFPGSKFVIW